MVTGLLVFARCAGFAFRAPGFSHPSVPPTLRAGLAAALAFAIAPAAVQFTASIDGVVFVIAMLGEFVLGSIIGMAGALVYDGAYAGGRLVDDYVGVKAIAPSVQLVAPSGFGRVWSLLFTGAFFLTGAYRLTLLNFAQSFSRLPPGGSVHPDSWQHFSQNFLAGLVLIALQVAAPAVGSALVVQVALGALSRVVPRFGSFTLAFPLAFAAALVVTAIGAPLAGQHLPQRLLALPNVTR